MELKHSAKPSEEKSPGVLIVPYGIETCTSATVRYSLPVLIVPYGIET